MSVFVQLNSARHERERHILRRTQQSTNIYKLQRENNNKQQRNIHVRCIVRIGVLSIVCSTFTHFNWHESNFISPSLPFAALPAGRPGHFVRRFSVRIWTVESMSGQFLLKYSWLSLIFYYSIDKWSQTIKAQFALIEQIKWVAPINYYLLNKLVVFLFAILIHIFFSHNDWKCLISGNVAVVIIKYAVTLIKKKENANVPFGRSLFLMALAGLWSGYQQICHGTY